MKEVESEKWLISLKGLGASVLAKIEAREGKVNGACLEVAAIIAGNFKNDRRFTRTGWMCRCCGLMEQEEP